MLESKKTDLANFIWKHFATDVDRHLAPNCGCMYVVDGGALLYRVTWPRPADYAKILESYVKYVRANYNEAIIVFDGYENEPSTKGMTQMRRSGLATVPKVVFEEKNAVSLKRDVFLTNKENKQALVNHLCTHLTNAGYQVKQATADADTLIAKTAIDAVQGQNVTLVADDTDLLCLLLYHFSKDTSHRLTMKARAQKESVRQT